MGRKPGTLLTVCHLIQECTYEGVFLTLIFFLVEEETKVICFDQGLLMEGSRLNLDRALPSLWLTL